MWNTRRSASVAKRSRHAACALGVALQLVHGCTQEGGTEPMQTPPAPTGAAGNSAPPPNQGPATPAMMEAPTAPPGVPMEPAAPVAPSAPSSDASVAVDAGAMDEPELPWEPLITAEWELAAGEERYFCQRVTLTEDVYFRGVRAINPRGTHHTALTAEPGAASAPDGLSECRSALSPQGIFGSGPGTDPVLYPEGVGLRLRAGQQLLLNLHVFNTSTEPLRGTSGTEIVKTTPDLIEHVAESLLAGPMRLDLPAHQETTVTGTCTMRQDTTLFAVQPHMHQLGIHMRGVAESSIAGTVELHDGPFDFEQQLVYPIEPVQMRAGDVVRIECTFDNTTDQRVALGESSNAEMCFLVLHRYPASDNPQVTCFF